MEKPTLSLEGDHPMSSLLTWEGATRITDQTFEPSCGKARVSIRARSDFSLV